MITRDEIARVCKERNGGHLEKDGTTYHFQAFSCDDCDGYLLYISRTNKVKVIYHEPIYQFDIYDNDYEKAVDLLFEAFQRHEKGEKLCFECFTWHDKKDGENIGDFWFCKNCLAEKRDELEKELGYED